MKPVDLQDEPSGLAALTQSQLDTWVVHAKTCTPMGRLPDYIPLLAKVNPQWVAVQVQQINGEKFSAGDVQQPFALMSVVKPFTLLFLLEQFGREQVFTHVGMNPSDQSFHSLQQLKEDRGFPRNPMINSGAIALAGLLPGKDGTARCEALRLWLNQLSGSQLVLNEHMLASVRSLSNEANRAIAELLAKSGHLDSVEIALDTYNQICCLSGTVADLAKLGTLLAGGDVETQRRGDAETSIQNSKFKIQNSPSTQHLKMVNALMLTCGLYEASGRFAVRMGLPTKSGVSGALLSVVPGQGAIACYSPALDSTGNSVAGLFLLEKLSQELDLSVFS
ncbi:glutaminase A [Kovacikia minuta CCNUW1]|uniref:glutaminase A n=1 Tax=Kovacikia minuta TaxID=2931930 RepID=UPI001CCBDA89|nr:glutaminase A [Kovacikia minuta]UBF29393.1 glutaminase A [Kovacikia minuta CCNUW1]